MIVFDITDEESFKSKDIYRKILKWRFNIFFITEIEAYWFDQIQEKTDEKSKAILIGNKLDLSKVINPRNPIYIKNIFEKNKNLNRKGK